MTATVEKQDRNIIQSADNETAGVSGRGRPGKAGEPVIWNFCNSPGCSGHTSESAAEHHGETRDLRANLPYLCGSLLRRRGLHGLGHEVRIVRVAIGDDLRLHWPLYPKGWVVPADAASVFRGPGFAHLVKYFGLIDQRDKSMSDTLGQIKHLAIFCRQFEAEMAFE